jgi:hypothetical protein
MSEATPFVNCGAAIHARNIKSEYLCKHSNWTNAEFNRAIEEMRSLVKSINLSDPLKEEVCDELERIRREGIGLNSPFRSSKEDWCRIHLL